MEKEQDIQHNLREMMSNLAKTLDGVLKPQGIGFAVLMFPFNDMGKGRINYISNADRQCMLAAMKEFIAKNEGRHFEHGVKQ